MSDDHASGFVRVRGAREHNLKNIDLEIPRDQFVVITGLSGSGKSSLAFDTIFAEGQRRYVESLSSYARQFLGIMDKPDVDSIALPPSALHLFGTDAFGFDVFSRVLDAATRDIPIAIAGSLVSLILGVPVGLAASSGKIGDLIMRGLGRGHDGLNIPASRLEHLFVGKCRLDQC